MNDDNYTISTQELHDVSNMITVLPDKLKTHADDERIRIPKDALKQYPLLHDYIKYVNRWRMVNRIETFAKWMCESKTLIILFILNALNVIRHYYMTYNIIISILSLILSMTTIMLALLVIQVKVFHNFRFYLTTPILTSKYYRMVDNKFFHEAVKSPYPVSSKHELMRLASSYYSYENTPRVFITLDNKTVSDYAYLYDMLLHAIMNDRKAYVKHKK